LIWRLRSAASRGKIHPLARSEMLKFLPNFLPEILRVAATLKGEQSSKLLCAERFRNFWLISVGALP
jgi:hypothetical protein